MEAYRTPKPLARLREGKKGEAKGWEGRGMIARWEERMNPPLLQNLA